MTGLKFWLVLIGGLAAIVGQWWGMDFYLSVIGGFLAIISLVIKK